MTPSRRMGWWLPVLAVTLGLGCRTEPEAGVLVNVQLESASLEVSRLRLRGYVQGEVLDALEVERTLPEDRVFSLAENLFLLVPEAWIGRTVWLTAEGVHQGTVTAHGQTSVVPKKNNIVEATLLLVAGPPPCGNGRIDSSEQCDGTNLGGQTCEYATGLQQGSLHCVECQLDTAGCHDCGNGDIEAPVEQCDGDNLAGETCLSQGFVSGALRCGGDCRLDRTDCAQGCGNGVIEGSEACDGKDLANQSCLDRGFLRGALGCTPDCEIDESQCEGGCGDAVLDPGEACDASDVGDQSCFTAAGRLQGELGCTSDCHLDVSGCHTCGDGLIEGGEHCDGPSLSGETCSSQGFGFGTLACAPDCSLDLAGCSQFGCGDGLVTGAEVCDGTNLVGESCLTQGFGGGALGCDPGCLSFDTSGCGVVFQGCGNGFVAATEECDDGNLTAGDGCDPSCLFEPGFRCYDDPSICVADASALFVDCGAAVGGTGTLADPFDTIQLAVDSATPGQLVWLLPATCTESVTVSQSDVVIAGDASALWSAAVCPALDVVNQQVVVWGLHLLDGVRVSGAGASLAVRHSEIGPSTGSCEAAAADSDAHLELHRCDIHDNTEGGVWVVNASFDIVNNFIVDNGTAGDSFRGGVSLSSAGYSPTTLVNNTIAFNQGKSAPFISGVRCVSPVLLINNIIWMNSTPEVSSGCDPWYNDISGGAWVGIQGNISVLPQFVDQPGGDYHILSTSPCVDTADPSGIPPAPPVDFDGEARPMGNGVDMGADEAA